MGKLLKFTGKSKYPVGVRTDTYEFVATSPIAVLEHFLMLARADQLLFLAVSAVHVDGHMLHAELGLVTEEGDPPVVPA